uniref:C-type lectin domain-containing protein n=1 Tax=Meloidogyne javanica TaxID=6303 RepID=A0A915M759_MELJA
MDPAYQTDDDRNQPVESVPSEQAPWISGPQNQKYQFHIGKQSWLSAREKCLAQNADLVSIESIEEMQWLLSHYKPQFNHLRERQVQIGLLLDTIEGEAGSNSDSGLTSREWRWVNGKPLNLEITKWTMGEPFDHAKGKERCALLNINERRLDDVDCDLGSGAGFNYRFVCQRSHEKHIEHESLNNPLWKKLEDILTFFGISDREEDKKNCSLPIGAKEEGYWERAFNKGEGNSETQHKEKTTIEKTDSITEKSELEITKGVEKNSKPNKEDRETVLEDKTIIEKKVITNKNEEKTNKLSSPSEQKLVKDVEKVVEEKKVSKVGGVTQHATSKIIGGEDEQPPNELENTRPTGGAVVLRRVESHVSASSSVDNKKNNNQEKLKEGTEEAKSTKLEEEQSKIAGTEEANIREKEASDSSDSSRGQSGLSVREKSQIINLNSRENIQSSLNPKKPLIISNDPSDLKEDRNTISNKNTSDNEKENKNTHLSKSVQITEKKLGEDEISEIKQYTLENKYIVNTPKVDKKNDEKIKEDKLNAEKINEEKISEKEEKKEDKIRNGNKDDKKGENEEITIVDERKSKKEDKEIEKIEENNKEDREVKRDEGRKEENEKKSDELKKNEVTREKNIKEEKLKSEETKTGKEKHDEKEEKEDRKNLLPKSNNIRDDSKKLDLENIKEEKLEANLIKNKINNEIRDVKKNEEVLAQNKVEEKIREEQSLELKDKDKKDDDKSGKKSENAEEKTVEIKEAKEDSNQELMKANNKEKDGLNNETTHDVKNEATNSKINELDRETKKEVKMEENREAKDEAKLEAKHKMKIEATEANEKESVNDAKSEAQSETKGEARHEAETKISEDKIIKTNKPTKHPDPLSVVAETLERSLSSKEETIEKKKDEAENLIKEKRQKPDGVRDRIQHLEKIITEVQHMMGIGEKGGEGELIEKTNKVLEEDEEEKNHSAVSRGGGDMVQTLMENAPELRIFDRAANLYGDLFRMMLDPEMLREQSSIPEGKHEEYD